MRCRACNRRLSDSEACVKNKSTKEYDDLCSSCRNTVAISILELEREYYDSTGQLTYDEIKQILSDYDTKGAT